MANSETPAAIMERQELPTPLEGCKLALAALEASLLHDDPEAATQMEWEAEPLATLRRIIEAHE